MLQNIPVGLTSNKNIGRVGVEAWLGVDTQGVETLIFFVEVHESQSGPLSTPVHGYPLRRWQGDTWWISEVIIKDCILDYLVIYGKGCKFYKFAQLLHTGPTISGPHNLWLVAFDIGVDNDRTAQTHSLSLTAKWNAKLVNDGGVEGDAILRAVSI